MININIADSQETWANRKQRSLSINLWFSSRNPCPASQETNFLSVNTRIVSPHSSKEVTAIFVTMGHSSQMRILQKRLIIKTVHISFDNNHLIKIVSKMSVIEDTALLSTFGPKTCIFFKALHPPDKYVRKPGPRRRCSQPEQFEGVSLTS